jgi:arylsulfatase A-like enzyme
MKYFLSLLFLVLIYGCDRNDEPEGTNTSDTPNILFIIADDMGKDATQGFSEGSIKPNTPNLNKLKNEGLSFNNFWVNPTCSPTRASMITGKYGYRTGVKWAAGELSQSEKILQKYIAEETNDTYASAIVGKWHLSGENININPKTFGLDYYAGLVRGAVQDYYQWQFYENGSVNIKTEYITKVFTDLSIDWINSQSKPWFLWIAYNAPHTPFHVPPSEMHSQGNLPTYIDGLEPMPYYMAAIEAMDYQIGKLLEGIPDDELDNTIIIFIGDNGTPNQVAQSPYSNSTVKGSLYQGGINVPLFISGAEVSRIDEDNSLICSSDIFSTIAELAGVSTSEIHDSKSFKTLLNNEARHRDFQYSEMNDGTDDLWTISNGEFKLIVNANGNKEMYNLLSDPYENNNLLNITLMSEEENAKIELETELLIIRN